MNVYHENQIPWPAGKPLTPPAERKKGQFKSYGSSLLLGTGAKRVEDAVAAFTFKGKPCRTKELWIFADGETGAKGRFLANQRATTDCRVVVQFDLDGKEYVIATDKLTEPAQSLAAIAAHIEGIRAQERYGLFTPDEMLSGFAALPAPKNYFAGISDAEALHKLYRQLAFSMHPDRGGDASEFAEMRAQYEAMRSQF